MITATKTTAPQWEYDPDINEDYCDYCGLLKHVDHINHCEHCNTSACTDCIESKVEATAWNDQHDANDWERCQ